MRELHAEASSQRDTSQLSIYSAEGPQHNTEGGPVFVSMVIAGPLVAGRTKDFVQRILAASAGGQTQHKERDEAAG